MCIRLCRQLSLFESNYYRIESIQPGLALFQASLFESNYNRPKLAPLRGIAECDLINDAYEVLTRLSDASK